MNLSTNNFPVQKSRALENEPRRDCGANSKRLICSESALVAFTVPIADRIPEVHETSKPTRDGEGVPTGALCGQSKGVRK